MVADEWFLLWWYETLCSGQVTHNPKKMITTQVCNYIFVHFHGLLIGVVQFCVQVSQSFRQKDLGGWVVCKNLSERIVEFQKPVHLIYEKFMIANTSIVLKLKCDVIQCF